MRFLRAVLLCILPLLLGPACRHPRPAPAGPPIQVRISSLPEKARVFRQGKPFGETPQEASFASADDLVQLTADLEGAPPVETRIRFLSTDRAEVLFRFGPEASPLAKTLGYARVLVFDYGAAVTFEFGKADIQPGFMPLLERQAALLKAHFADQPVVVCGHTDAIGSADFNLSLSLDRARAVADELKRLGVPGERMSMQGFGSTYPVAPNDTEEERAQNRRTEVILPL